LQRIRIPALLLNARNDPFVPASCLPLQQDVGSYVKLWQPEQGGHVGFTAGRPPGRLLAMPELVCDWLASNC
jgi:predicted alpha/beta-fold hydrolase